MRIPFISMFVTSPFQGLQEHAEKVKECSWVFQQAMECYISVKCDKFEDFRQKIDNLEGEADSIKRRIRGHIPKGTLLPVDKFELFRYLGEQDKVLDSVEKALSWVSIRTEQGVPEPFEKDILLLVDVVLDPIEALSEMVEEARKYFSSFSEKQRDLTKNLIHKLRQYEHETDELEEIIKRKIFNTIKDPIVLFHMIRLVEIIGNVADHAENAGDMMRAMIAK